MTQREILDWLNRSPVPGGSVVHADFLPSYEGWSFTAAGRSARDILGKVRTETELRLYRRGTAVTDEDRLRLLEELAALADWAVANPPAGARVRLSALPKFSGRSPSGVEDMHALLRIID